MKYDIHRLIVQIISLFHFSCWKIHEIYLELRQFYFIHQYLERDQQTDIHTKPDIILLFFSNGQIARLRNRCSNEERLIPKG